MDRRVQTRIAGIVVAVTCLACVSSMPYTTTTRHTRTQSALTFAPAGPHATGEMARDGQGTLEGAVHANVVTPANRSREAGALGNVTTNFDGRVRFGYGLFDRVEFGADLEISSGALAGASASDVARGDYHDRWIARGGLQVRGILVGSRRIGLGGNVEGSFGSIAYTATDVHSTTSTAGGPNGSGMDTVSESAVVAWARVGLFLHAMPTEHFALLGGLLAQTTPRIDGRQEYSDTCVVSPGSRVCSYSPDPWPAPYVITVVGTLWASVSYSIGPVVLIGQIAGNVIADAPLRDTAPIGADLALRYAF